MKLRLVSPAIFVTVVFMAACGPVGSSTTLLKLPVPATTAGATAAATNSSPISSFAPIVYRLGAALPPLPATAPAYDVAAGPSNEERHRIASALGVADTDRRLFVDRGTGSWSFDANCAAPAGSDQVGGFACSSIATSAPAAVLPCPPASTGSCQVQKPAEPVRPVDLPSKQAATDRARSVFHALGVNASADRLHVTDGSTEWFVSADPVVGGLPTTGRTTTVTIGPRGVIAAARGFLGSPTKIGEYRLVDATTVGFGRLVDAEAHRPRPMIAMAMPCRADVPDCGGTPAPRVLTLTGVHLALQQIGTKLVPAFVFEAGANETVPPVPAVIDSLLQVVTPPVPVEPQPAPGQVGGGAPGVTPGGTPTKP